MEDQPELFDSSEYRVEPLPVVIHVEFNSPSAVHHVLYGKTLEAYNAWLEDDSYENEEIVAEHLFDDLYDHILAWTTIGEWYEVTE